MGKKTDWIMHEYRLESEENGPPQEEGWVVCRAFKKRTTSGQTKGIEAWDSSYFYDEPSGASSVVDPLDYITRQPQNNYLSQNFMCKQEIEAENLNNFLNTTDPFAQLPQLESPSMPQLKKPSAVTLVSENAEDDEQTLRGCSSSSKKVTDWRALDKFVASQLSHDQQTYEGDVVSAGFEGHESSDLGLLLLQSGREEGSSKLNGFFSSSSDCDIGICVFDK